MAVTPPPKCTEGIMAIRFIFLSITNGQVVTAFRFAMTRYVSVSYVLQNVIHGETVFLNTKGNEDEETNISIIRETCDELVNGQ